MLTSDFTSLARNHRLLVTRKCRCGWTFEPDGRYWTDHHDEHLGEVIASELARAVLDRVGKDDDCGGHPYCGCPSPYGWEVELTRVHNHEPWRPMCNERRLPDGQLRGACLNDDGTDRD